MTNDEIKAAVDRANAATPGPWREHFYTAEVTAIDGSVTVASCNIGGTRVSGGTDQQHSDAAFVAAARTDVSLMAEEIRWLRTELADMTERRYASCDCVKIKHEQRAATRVIASIRGKKTS